MFSFIPPNTSPASADFVDSPLWNGHLEQAMEQAKAIITRETADMEEGPESYGWLLVTTQIMLREWAKDRATANMLRQQSRHQDEEIRRQDGEIIRLKDELEDGFEKYESARGAAKQWEEYANQCNNDAKEEAEKARKAQEQKISAKKMCRELEKRNKQLEVEKMELREKDERMEEEILRLREAMKDNEGLWDASVDVAKAGVKENDANLWVASLEVSRTGLELSRKALGKDDGGDGGGDSGEDGGEDEEEEPRGASGDAL